MIAKMAKYDFVLYAAQSEDFIEKLRELGLVDITTTGWEPSEEDRQLLLDIEGHTKAADFLRNFRAGEGRFKAGAKPFASGAEAYEHYVAAHQKATALAAEIGRLEKSADELRPWGEFSPERTKALASQGIVLRYFFTPKSNYDKFGPEWSERYTLSLINRTDSTAYFVAVTAPGEDVTLDAQEMKPSKSPRKYCILQWSSSEAFVMLTTRTHTFFPLYSIGNRSGHSHTPFTWFPSGPNSPVFSQFFISWDA